MNPSTKPKTWIALLRGINVGGHNILPMAELREGLESLGFQDVRTYIQSGNVVFKSAEPNREHLQKCIEDWIEAGYGFRSHLMLLRREELVAAVDANPFPQAVDEPKTLYFFFLAEPAHEADWKAMEKDRAETETTHLTESVFYLYTPGGIGISKLAANVQRHLRVVMTARNFRTVAKLVSMAED